MKQAYRITQYEASTFHKGRLVDREPRVPCDRSGTLSYCISGRMNVAMEDGTEDEITPGDVVSIEPGNDAWAVGDEPRVAIDFGGYAQYAKQ